MKRVAKRSPPAHVEKPKLTKPIQTYVSDETAAKLAVRLAQLDLTEAAYMRRLIRIDLGELSKEDMS